METQDLKVLGYASVMVAVLLFAAGLFAKYYSRVSSTPRPADPSSSNLSI